MASDWFVHNDSLTVIERDCWGLLRQAVTDRDCGWRLPVLSTSTAAGVRQRILVLRSVDAEHRQLMFHTDCRSPKFTQLQADPCVSLLFYDHTRSVQLQARGTVSLHTQDAIAEQLWIASAPETLRGYLAPLAPGTIVEGPDDNLPDHVRGRIPAWAEVEPGRAQFAVICVHIARMDWLALSRTGNRRVRIRYDEGRPVSCEWIAP